MITYKYLGTTSDLSFDHSRYGGSYIDGTTVGARVNTGVEMAPAELLYTQQ